MPHVTQSNLSVSSAVVNHWFSRMSKRAGESFAASARAKQKPVHCAAMIAKELAKELNDKNAGIDYHAVLPPDCQSWRRVWAWTLMSARSSKHSPWRRLEHHRAPGDRWLWEIRQTLAKGKFIFRQTLMHKITPCMFDDLANEFRATERGAARSLQSCLGQYVCEIWRISSHSPEFFRSTLRSGANSRATAYGLHLDWPRTTRTLKRMAMEKRFPRTQDWIQSVQRQVQTLIDRIDRTQYAGIAGLEDFSLVKNYVTEWSSCKIIKIRVRLFSDYTFFIGVSNPDPSNNWTTKLDDVWNEHGFVKTLIL